MFLNLFTNPDRFKKKTFIFVLTAIVLNILNIFSYGFILHSRHERSKYEAEKKSTDLFMYINKSVSFIYSIFLNITINLNNGLKVV